MRILHVKRWSDRYAWVMAKCIDRVDLAATKDAIKHAILFFILGCDEVIVCDT